MSTKKHFSTLKYSQRTLDEKNLINYPEVLEDAVELGLKLTVIA